jgi:acetylornithine deacetylase
MKADKLLSMVDRKMVVDLATEMINTPSPTGEEGNMARLLARMFKEVGLTPQLQNIYDDRYNVIGRLVGRGTGPAILMSGHMDTSVRGDEDYLTGKGWKNQAAVEDDRIFGNGIMNMKNAFVSYIAGVDAMQRAGLKLEGDLTIAGVAGEIEMASVDEFLGKHYHGHGMGTRFMLIHGVSADYHFLGEPTGQIPSTGLMGTSWVKITTHGDFAHTAYANRTLSAIDEMWLLWHGLSEWIEEYEKKNVYKDVIATVNRAALRGGLPWRAARTPNQCSLYLDIRYPPTRFPIDIEREFTAVVKAIAKDKLKRAVDIQYYMSRPGTQLPDNHAVVQAIVDAHQETTGQTVQARFCAPYCADAIDANRFGIPTCVYGSGGGTRSNMDGVDLRAKEGEFVTVDDMVSHAATIIRAAMWLNDVGLDRTIAMRGPMPSVTSAAT